MVSLCLNKDDRLARVGQNAIEQVKPHSPPEDVSLQVSFPCDRVFDGVTIVDAIIGGSTGVDHVDTAAAAFSPTSRSSAKRLGEKGRMSSGVFPVWTSSAMRAPVTGPALNP
jgi:hypothetical protein